MLDHFSPLILEEEIMVEVKMDNYIKVVDSYQKIRGDREKAAEKFLSGERPYMIYQTPETSIYNNIRTPEDCFCANIEYIQKAVMVLSDDLPFIEPWFGTGVFANMYGCPYVWREGMTPAVHYRYKSIEEIKGIKKPCWENGEITSLILDTIRYFKSKTGNELPIVWTDTQSASDTATLILDASEVFIGCMIEPETMMDFMKGINKLIIEFSQVQAELIGDALVKPGHIMISNKGFRGMAISDDNMAVASPAINEQFNLPLDEEIGKAMGGIAIHSCGSWAHTMVKIKEKVPSCTAIDCAVDLTMDPNPNDPEKVRDAFAGSGITVHARMTGETGEMLETVKRLFHKELKLIIRPQFIDMQTAERNYFELDKLLHDLYKG